MLNRLFNENHLDLMVELLSEKKYREFACSKYIEENPILSKQIIKDFNFKSIENKYILKTRMYVEGSYSKRKIKLEEEKFISKLVLFRYFQHQIYRDLDFFKKLKKNIKDENIITDNEYKLIIYIYKEIKKNPECTQLFDIDNQVDIKNILAILELKGVREKMTKYFIKNDLELALYLIEVNQFKRIKDKYILKINKYDNNSYSRNKIKEEEYAFCLKIIALEKWKFTVKDVVEYTNYYENYFNEEIKLNEEYLLKIIYTKIEEMKNK